ncbi:MAG: hypothetical protein H6567_06440 [Lewinellaceae bacterium]|nr:hypothetical protein [Lewinellaceae bacterium]
MFRFFIYSAIVIWCFSPRMVYSQQWVPDLELKGDSLNFFEIQQAFNNFYKDKDLENTKGWKQFKRWEWYWEDRVDKDGNFPPAGKCLEEFNQYLRAHRTGKRLPSNWISLGPGSSGGGYAGHGRINSIGFHPTNNQIIFAGTAAGGLWQSNDGGSSWVTHTDALGSLGISAIVVDPTDPNIIYIATGDGDAGDNYSVGVLKSTDGGVTFLATGLNWNVFPNRLIRAMVMDPNDHNIVIAATSDGIYKTSDAGANWTQVQTGNFYDVEARPDASSDYFYASNASQIFRSTDQGDSWSSVKSINGSNRITLAVTPADNTIVYALSSKSSNNGYNGIYRSTNSGNTFTRMSFTPNILGWNANGGDTGGQGWYDLALAADPANASIIYAGGVNTWKSTNGGDTWTLTSHWSGAPGVETIHADKHVLTFRGSDLWEGNDGGLYVSSNGGVNWTNKTDGIVHSLQYKIGVSQSDDKVISGLQDNGTKLLSGTDWQDVLGGDGMDCSIHKNLSKVMFGEYYNGNIFRSVNGGLNFGSINDHISGSPTGGWVTPYLFDPSNNNTVYIGFADVYKSLNRGDTWTKISTLGIGNLVHIAVAPSNPSVIITGTAGAIRKTTNGGSSWTSITVPATSVSMIAFDPMDENIMYLTAKNYTSGQKVFKTTNGGSSWTNISGTLPNIPANCVTTVKGYPDALYIGMDIGVYRYDVGSSDWVLFSQNLPNVEITELEVDYTENKLFAATYGRSLWVSDLHESLPVCQVPVNLQITGSSSGSLSVSWESPTIPPDLGYEYALAQNYSMPTSGTPTTELFTTMDIPTPGTTYFVYVRSKCSSTDYSEWISVGPFFASPTCGGVAYDSGGSGSNYKNGEDYTWTVCGHSDCYNATLTFTSFDVEADWDALYIHNGDDISAPIFSSGNGITQAGFPAGGYYGTTLPPTYTSSHASGCLTLHFRSDEYTSGTGWAANVTCTRKDPLVTNTSNDGLGSLRYAIDCITSGDTITFHPTIPGQMIDLNSGTIIINKDVHILQSASTVVKIKANNFYPLFTVNIGNELILEYVDIYPATGLFGRAILNNGSLTLDNTNIIEEPGVLGDGSSIENNGNITVKNQNTIRE